MRYFCSVGEDKIWRYGMNKTKKGIFCVFATFHNLTQSHFNRKEKYWAQLELSYSQIKLWYPWKSSAWAALSMISFTKIPLQSICNKIILMILDFVSKILALLFLHISSICICLEVPLKVLGIYGGYTKVSWRLYSIVWGLYYI